MSDIVPTAMTLYNALLYEKGETNQLTIMAKQLLQYVSRFNKVM